MRTITTSFNWNIGDYAIIEVNKGLETMPLKIIDVTENKIQVQFKNLGYAWYDMVDIAKIITKEKNPEYFL